MRIHYCENTSPSACARSCLELGRQHIGDYINTFVTALTKAKSLHSKTFSHCIKLCLMDVTRVWNKRRVTTFFTSAFFKAMTIIALEYSAHLAPTWEPLRGFSTISGRESRRRS